MNVDPIEAQCPGNVVRKKKLTDLDYVINEIQISSTFKTIKGVYLCGGDYEKLCLNLR